MKRSWIGVSLALVVCNVGALAAPQVGSSAKPPTPASQAPAAKQAPTTKVSARPALTKIKVSAVDVERAKAHQFGLVEGAISDRDEQKEGVALVPVAKSRAVKGRTPKLNIAKFGETVHAAFKDKVRGYALGLRQNDQNKLTLVWDWARTPEQGGKAWTLDTRMHVASVSKLITAMAVTNMLHNLGRHVDMEIGQHLPRYWEVPASSYDITFRDLLTHHAGFTIYDGDFRSFKRQIEQGVITNAEREYTNGAFSLLRVLVSTMTGSVRQSTVFEVDLPVDAEALNDAMWDLETREAFLNYVQKYVFTPSGVASVSAEPGPGGAYAYSGKTDKQGWNSGDLSSQLGGAGFRLSVNEVLNVMGTFRRKGTILPVDKAQKSIEAGLGLDTAIDTPAGTVYTKNGRWKNGQSQSADMEQSVACFMPNNIEVVVFVNSWLGSEAADLRSTITNAYIANLE